MSQGGSGCSAPLDQSPAQNVLAAHARHTATALLSQGGTHRANPHGEIQADIEAIEADIVRMLAVHHPCGSKGTRSDRFPRDDRRPHPRKDYDKSECRHLRRDADIFL